MQMTAKLAATKNTWTDPDDAPELTTEWFEKADLMQGEEIVRPGRKLGSGTKELQTVRFDRDVLVTFKSTGKGWQTRMNNALRVYLKEHPLKAA
jgi:uncharacterized protein (DUF4415 family)